MKLKKFLKSFFVSIVFVSLILFHGTGVENSAATGARLISVTWVIDGDTIVIKGGERIRYVGIDAPEIGEAFYKMAKAMNAALLKKKAVTFIACEEFPRDKYGRLLGWAYADGVDVSSALLKEGMARTLTIPPCGLKKAKEYKIYEDQARSAGRGIWRSMPHP